jgi:hypothetical protein
MTFLDKYTERTYSLQDMKSAYDVFRLADPHNHAKTFTRELASIITDTLNGRNDLSIIGLTDMEASLFAGALILKTRGINYDGRL